MFLQQIEKYPVGGKVALFRDLVQYLPVFTLVFIGVVMVDIEEAVTPQPAWLMNLEVNTYAWHFLTLVH